jgi:hypothetical protein
MRRNLGATAGVVALLALAFHSMNPPAGERRNSSSPSGQAGATGGKNSKDQDKVENVREGPWLATRAFFGPSGGAAIPSGDDGSNAELKALASPAVSPKDATTLRNLFGTDPSICSGTESYSLVATVADPAHTRLALFFDGQIDSIERAAQSGGWVFARQWLPWIDAFDSSDHNIETRREQRRLEREQEALPGILVFRPIDAKARPKGCLFVLLVPETPTGGVAEDSFFAALNIADLLSPETQIGLLAPSFSGSFPSLSHAVSAWQKHQLRLYRTAYGGSVSSRRAALAFHESTDLNFLSGIPSDLDVAKAFGDLMGKYGIGLGSSAYLVEQESGFGADAADAVHAREITDANQSGKTSGASAVVYEFPRDISHLRNAYQTASAGNSGRDENPIPSIQLSLNDPSRGEDSIPVFSDTGTPVVQSAALGQITEDLVRRGIRVAYVSATNSLDELFLAQFLRQQCPNVRVVITGDTDLLFLPAAAQRSLSGTLFLSPYPMFFEGDEALSSNSQATRYSLSSGNLVGLFNVTKLLLWHIQRGRRPPALRSYAGMGPNPGAYPGLWLLELTRFGFSPVDWKKTAEPDGWLESNPNPPTQIAGVLPRPIASPGWYITSRFTGLGIVAGFIIFLCMNRTNRISWPVWRRSTGEKAIRFPLFAGACLFTSSLPWILGIPGWFEWEKASWRQNATVVLLGLAFATPLMCLFWIAAKRIHERRRPPFGWYLDPVAPLSLLLYLLVLIGWWRLCDGSDVSHSMFRWRSLHLYSSSSPAVPLLLICLILAVGLLAEFYRRSDTGRASPHLKLDPTRGIPAFHAYYLETDQLISGQRKLTRFVTSVLATAVSMLLLWRYLPAFEVEPYSWGLKIFVAASIWTLASLGHDAVLIWFSLSRMLVLIESIPLRNVFTRIARGWPRRQVWAFWKSTPRQTLAVQMSEALHNLSKAGTDKRKDLAISFFGLVRDRFAGTPDASFEDYSDARLKYEEKAAEAAEELFFAELWPTWEASPIDDQALESKENVSAKEHRFAADFVALQCCNYLIHAVRQTQRIVWTISFLLVLLIVFLNSYAAQGPQFIGRYLVVLFAATGCIVVYVFAGMERNWILSQISHTKPGELNAEFFLHIGALGALPLIGLAVHLFPELATFLYSWVAPGVESLK